MFLHGFVAVEKSRCGRARMAFVVTVEMLSFVLALVLTLLVDILIRSSALRQQSADERKLCIPWCYFVIMALYPSDFYHWIFQNCLFLRKTLYLFLRSSFVVIGIMETLYHIPGLNG